MVSGFLTSPNDQDFMTWGEAKPAEIDVKSAWLVFKDFNKSLNFISYFSSSNSMFMPNDLISLLSTLNDSGTFASIS